MAKQVFNVKAALARGLTEPQIDAFVAANPNLIRSDQTLTGRVGGAANWVAFDPEGLGLFKRTKDLFQGRMYRPEEYASQQFKSQTTRKVQQEMRQGKPLQAVGTALTALPQQLGMELKEAAPAGAELAPWVLPPLKLGKAASVGARTLPGIAGRVGGAGLTAALETGMYAGTEPGKTGAQKWEQFKRTAPTAAVFAGTMQAGSEALSTAAEKFGQGAKRAAETKAAREMGEEAVEKVRIAGRETGKLPANVLPEDIDIEKWYPKTLGDQQLTPGERMIFEQLDVGSVKQQNRLKPFATIKQNVRYGNYGNINDMYWRSNIATDQLDDVVNRLAKDPTLVVKIDDVPSISLRQSNTAGIDPSQLQAARIDTGDVYARLTSSAHDKGLPFGYASLDDAFKAWRDIRDMGWSADFLNRTAYGVPDPANQRLADFYFSYADNLMDSINKTASKAKLDKAFLNQNKAVLQAAGMPVLADDIAKAQNLQQLNSLFTPFLRMREMVDITRNKYASAFTRGFQAIAQMGRRGMIPWLASKTLDTPMVRGAAGAAMIRAEQTPAPYLAAQKAAQVGQRLAEPIRRAGQSVIQSLGGVE